MKKTLLYVTAALALAAVLTVPAFAADAPAEAAIAASLELTTAEAPAATMEASATDAVTFPTTSTFDAQPMALNCQRGYIPPSSCVCGNCCDLCRCWNGGALQKCIPW